ncbi:glycosyltransferase [Clostridium algidicarnis]|nr:glycosyltransferase [Clostridium algidicarnis]
MMVYPKISFLIVNYNGKEHLKECFSTLNNLDYPKEKLEYILVDNGSYDDSVEYIKENFPETKIIENQDNQGFAKPNNDAAKIATGDYLALINNDMKIDENWLYDMLESLSNCNDEKYICIGSKVLNWDGSKLDFAGGGINFYGFGYQDDYAMDIKKAEEKHNEDKDILFASGGAMLIDRKVFLEVGGFDEDYFAYFEDIDLGWRLWILGYKVRFSSKSICYHKHNSTSKKFNQSKVKVLFERNALYTIYKNYSKENFNLVLGAILLANKRLQLDLKIDSKYFDIESSVEGTITADVSPENLATLIATNYVLDNIDKLNKKRGFIQENRKVTDEELKDLFTNPMVPLPFPFLHKNDYLDKLENIVKEFKIDDLYGKEFSRKILLISNDRIGKKMAGPGIRYWEFARQLSITNKVTLAIPNEVNIKSPNDNIEIVEYDQSNPIMLGGYAEDSDIVILQGTILEQAKELKAIVKRKILIVDIYDPFVIENLEIYKHKEFELRNNNHNENLRVQIEQLKIGDYFICASEEQMNFWVGMLSTLNKINPSEYDLSSKLEKLIGIVPFGICEENPVQNRDAMKEKVPNFKSEDKVFIWGGGVWNWFDPLTLISAVNEISKQRDDIKVFFLGVKHPNPAVPEMEMTNNAIKLAEEYGIKDKYIFFNMDWVDYDDRQNYLLQSFAGVSCHFDNLETRFSFRTRILDYLWGSLPIVSTEGDFFAGEIEKYKLGITVKYKDVDDLKSAMIKLVDDDVFYNECKNNIDKYKERFKWNVATKPLIDFCKNPTKKSDTSVKEYIYDINQNSRDSVVGEIVDGKTFGQRFRCRYPNLSSIELMIATFGRRNSHNLKFKLFEAKSNMLIIEKNIPVEKLIDNAWIDLDFETIINSEAKEFYFYVETEGATKDNSITLWKNSQENRFGTVMFNGTSLPGSLVFRTKCIYSETILEQGITIPEEQIVLSNVNSVEELKILMNNVKDLKEKGKGRSVDEINILNQQMVDVVENISNINNWISHINSKITKLKKINIFKK